MRLVILPATRPDVAKGEQAALFDVGPPDPTRGGRLKKERRLDTRGFYTTRWVRSDTPSPKGDTSPQWKTKPKRATGGSTRPADASTGSCSRCGGAMPKGQSGDSCDACTRTIDWVEQSGSAPNHGTLFG